MEHDELMAADERFARWYGDHHDRVRRHCERMLRDAQAAEDVAQETLLRAWERRDALRDEDVGAWLSVVARNLCVSHMRRGWRVVPLEPAHDRPDHANDPVATVERNETRRNVRRALGGMSRRHRRVLYLREVDGVDYGELGSELGMTPEGVRSIAFRARVALRERLAAVGEGLSAIVVGVRMRARSFKLRSRTTRIVGEPTTASMMQSAVNAILALGIALVGTGTAAVAAGTDQQIVSRARARPTLALNPSDASVSDGAARSGAVPLADQSSGHGGGLIPRAGVRAFDPEEKRSEITLHIAGHDTGLIVEGMDGDGLDPAYRAIDIVFGPLCAEAPRACELLRGGG